MTPDVQGMIFRPMASIPQRNMGKTLRPLPEDHLKQAVALAREDFIFRSIKALNYEAVFNTLDTKPDQLDNRNDDGAAPVHFAFLHFQDELGRTLIEKYPRCALLEYGPGDYEGQNCLHIVISQRKYIPFVWLLTHHPELLGSETTGKFFAPGGLAYFGGYPLLFAVSTNQFSMVQRILDLKVEGVINGIHLADSHGNNDLHMAVIHNLPEMAQFLWELEAKLMGPSGNVEPLVERANSEHLTPLALAAAMGRVAMFRLLLIRGIKQAWVFGPIKGVLVPLRGLEQPYLSGRDRLSHRRLAMSCFCASKNRYLTECLPSETPDSVWQGRMEIANLPEIREILDKKWQHFGRRLYLQLFVPIIIVMVLWTIAIIIPNSYSEDPANLSDYLVNNGFIIACESIVLSYVVCAQISEYIAFYNQGKEYLEAGWGIVAVICRLRAFFCLFVVIDVGLRAGQQYNAQLVFTAIASLTGWMLVMANLVAMRTTGAFVLIVQNMMVNDVRRFSLVWILVVMAFTCAIYLTHFSFPGFTEPLVFWKIFRDVIVMGTVGEFIFLDFLDGPCPWLLNLLIVFYLFLQILILLSIIIATLSNTYKSTVKDADTRFYIERYNLMMYLEARYTVPGMYHQRLKYAQKLPHDATKYDANLYLPVVLTNTQWKGEVSLGQQPLIEARARKDILGDEQQGWSRILRCMADKGLYLPGSPTGVHTTPIYPIDKTFYY